ncbi:AbrB/MazE/SpoVT family DNA-binding domain-containing protein [Candidatus Bathyarchaeota archaeon]|nr:AbrB/MazE/SpoVT family DNA-binding domain-containing protein [Candidatus Bathyarchaeota archaeon]
MLVKELSLTIQTIIGKKYAVYLPRAVVKALGLREGEKVLLRVAGNTLILEAIQDPIQLALSGKKYASMTPEQVEMISLEEQAGRFKSPP